MVGRSGTGRRVPFYDTVRARRVDVERNDATLPSVFSDSKIKATGCVLKVKHEELIKAPVAESRRIVEFLGAEWNARLEKQFLKARSSSIGIHNDATRTKLRKPPVLRPRNWSFTDIGDQR